MAKKFDINVIKRGRDLSKTAKSINNINEVTIEAINKTENEPTKENIDKLIITIEKDTALQTAEKSELMRILQEQYFDIFNFNNCPDDYESLKAESKFLSGMTQYSFLLMAQRLLKIRNNELYKNDGYLDFKDFIVSELNIERSTVYKYIDLVSFFGVETFQHEEIEHTKLLPAIPLLKSENQEIPKLEIKELFIKESKYKSARELQNEAKDLKIKYGLFKIKNMETEFDKAIFRLKKTMPVELQDSDKIKVKKLITYLKDFLET